MDDCRNVAAETFVDDGSEPGAACDVDDVGDLEPKGNSTDIG